MPAKCPTCGQQLPPGKPAHVIRSADELVQAMLRRGGDGRPRDIYEVDRQYWRGRGPQYRLTYTPDVQVERAAIDDAIARSLIAPAFPNAHGCWALPDEAARYHEAWLVYERRKKR